LDFLTACFIVSNLMKFSYGQTNDSAVSNKQIKFDTATRFQYSFKTAHANAQALMTDDFFWSPIEETGPFGSDDGSDAAYGFRQWRVSNKSTSPINYLKELLIQWNYPIFNWNEMDTNKIKEYILSSANLDEASIQKKVEELKEAFKNSPDTGFKNLSDAQWRESIRSSSKATGGLYLLGQDNAIIGTGFAQFVLEGRIDRELKKLITTALKRQLLPLLINRYSEDYRIKRKEQLSKMLDVVNKTNS